MNVSIAARNSQVVEKIKGTTLYQSYASAFQAVTGLPLFLQPMHGETMPANSPQSAFCRQLNAHEACRACQCLHTKLMRDASKHAVTEQCAMGLVETAVPVKFGDETIALLKIGQVRHKAPNKSDFKALAKRLKEEGLEDTQIQKLADAYAKVTVIDSTTYKQTVTMLAVFSLHVTTLINQLILAQSDAEEPPIVTEAKRFIRENLEEKMTLEAIAKAVKVSPFYFCKIFKEATGMTSTEYVNRKRVEWAKKLLLNPGATITDTAFDVGYKSLSQFNRSFLRYVGESPTQYRKRMSEGAERALKVA